VKRDGSGYIQVQRGNKTIHFAFGSEDNELPVGATSREARELGEAIAKKRILDAFIED
jgi:hypothetical protein